MPTILRGFPYFNSWQARRATPAELENARMDRILIPVSITPVTTSWDEVLSHVAAGRHNANTVFAALLDTGCGHNGSIRQEDLKQFTQLDPNDLGPHFDAPINDIDTPFYDVTVWMHYNASYGSRLPSPEPPFPVSLNGGMGVHRIGEKKSYWLPLIGLPALEAAKLKVHIDSEKGLVTIHT